MSKIASELDIATEQTLLSYVVKVNREPIRSSARSISNAEMHGKIEDVNHVGSRIVKILEENGSPHSLSDEERNNGFILTCQPKPESDVEIDS